MSSYPFHILDVFTSSRFGGNQLAVVLDADGLSQDQMQTIAREFNFSETTFVRTAADGANTADVRIFTPVFEMPFAGHPTLGTATVLARQQAGNAESVSVRLVEKAGLVPVDLTLTENGAHGRFVSPALPEPPRPAPSAEDIAPALSLAASDIGFDGHAANFVKAGNDWLFVPVASMDALAKSAVSIADWPAMKGGTDVVGVVLYTRGGDAPDTDFRVRMYAPESGVPEDPATGSAMATLPGQIVPADGTGDGTHSWRVEQGYEMGRPSQIEVSADIAGGEIREVRIGGYSVEVARGTLEV